MPRIINAYSEGNESLAGSLKSLGDSMFGNQARNEYVRQNALKVGRENTFNPQAADALSRGDVSGAIAAGVRAGMTGADAANWNLLGASGRAGGNIDNPNLNIAQIAAHEPIASTAVGQGRSLANQRDIEGQRTASVAATQQAINERQIQQQQWADEHTLVNLRGPDGRVTMVPKSQVGGLQAHGYDVVPTLDQVKAGLISPSQSGAPAPDAASGAQPSLSGLTPDQRHIVGLPTNIQSYVHPQTGETVTSQDGGQTYTSPSGQRGTLAGSGYMPVSNEAAITEARAASQRAAALAPPAPAPDPTQSAAASDASKVAGLAPFLAEHANSLYGATGLGKVGEFLGIGGEVAPGIERARSAQDIRNNEARTALLAAPGRQSIQAQKWVNDLLPEEHALANPTTESAKVPTIVAALQADHANERKIIADINTPPAERQNAIGRLHKIESAIRMFTMPPAAAPAASAPQAGAPASAAPPQAGATAPPTAAAPAPGADPLSQARDAINRGAPREAVIQRLQQHGINPAGL